MQLKWTVVWGFVVASGFSPVSTPISTTMAQGSSPPSASLGPGPSAGCGGPVAASGQYKRKVLDGLGRERTYSIAVPAGYTGRDPVALVFGFHGNGGTGEGSLTLGVMQAAWPSSRAIFVGPDGVQFEHYGVGWNSACTGYDMTFFDNMIEDIGTNYCINNSHIFAYGSSWGGDFATALTCCRGDKLKAIAIHAASDEFDDKSDYRTYVNMTGSRMCPAPPHAAVRYTHQTDGDEYYPAPLFSTTSQLLRHLNGCPEAPAKPSGSICTNSAGCSAPLVECQYHGIGHNVPPNFGEETWSFFVHEMER